MRAEVCKRQGGSRVSYLKVMLVQVPTQLSLVVLKEVVHLVLSPFLLM